jgi:cob(I)alamin adenosyltransferase
MMGNRLSRIMTRTGDAGTTGLADGSRTDKDGMRIQAIGEVDELNSSLGLLLAEPDLPAAARASLIDIQHDLFDLGGELSLPGKTLIHAGQISRLEAAAEALNANLPRLKEFILPGGVRSAALAFWTRAVCRRAERVIVRLGHHETVSTEARRYINRLSDFLFILGRALNQAQNQPDTLWQRDRHPSSNPDPGPADGDFSQNVP